MHVTVVLCSLVHRTNIYKINYPSEILVWRTEFKIQLDVKNQHIKNTQNLIATEI